MAGRGPEVSLPGTGHAGDALPPVVAGLRIPP